MNLSSFSVAPEVWDVARSVGRAVAGWWTDVTAPQATLLSAVGLGFVGFLTLWQKLRTDRRDQWWKRAQWAVDLALTDDERTQIVGWAAIARLVESDEATRRDDLFLRQVVDAALPDEEEVDDDVVEEDPETVMTSSDDTLIAAGEDVDPHDDDDGR